MATVKFNRTIDHGRTHRFVWTDLALGDVGEPARIPGAADMTFQVIKTVPGTVGDAIILEGSCEEIASTYFHMRDAGDTFLSFKDSDGEAVAMIASHIRPRVTGGDSKTRFTAILLARSTMK